MARILPLLLSLALLCCAASQSTLRVPGEMMIRDEIYFGLSGRDGAIIGEQEWSRFLDTAITPRFPDGLTVIDAAGQYRLGNGLLQKERSRVVVLVHPASAENDSSVARICRSYVVSFNQESVMRVSSACGQAFIGR